MSQLSEAYNVSNKFILEKRDKLLIIKINNPRKKNSLNSDAYIELTKLLRTAAHDDAVNVVALTAVGDVYTAGNDLTASVGDTDYEELLKEKDKILQDFIRSFIEFPKLLVAVVNGPCIGIGMTTIALCDLVYCTDTAYFSAPFIHLGISPEACSSFTFPRMLGKPKAVEVLLLGQKLSADEALRLNFVAEVVKPHELETKIWTKIMGFTKLPIGALQAGKSLMVKACRKELEEALVNECKVLWEQMHSNEFFNAIAEFRQRKSKL